MHSPRPKTTFQEKILQFCQKEFVAIPIDSTVGEAIHRVRKGGPRGNIFYVYVLSKDAKLAGVVSLRNLLLAKDEEKLSQVLSPKVVHLEAHMSIQEACDLFARSKFLSLPVVRSDGSLLGVIHAHELVQGARQPMETLFEERSRGELYELLGVQAEDFRKSAITQTVRRLPWLMLNGIGGLLSAFLIHLLGGQLKEAVLFLAFVPAILIISESIGMQTASLVIANLHASGRMRSLALLRKEIQTALLLGGFCAVLLGGGVYLWKGSWPLSATLSTTIVSASLAASSVGNGIPFLFKRLSVDPRVAAGPVVLALSDSLTLLLYLILAIIFSR